MTQPHQVHDFSRLISSSDDGRAVYGCSFRSGGVAGCGETEIRQKNQPSPYAVKRAKAAATKQKPRRRGGA